jgi:drug/metabolite transporter (DMT)-like permease
MHISNSALFAISTLIWGSTWLAITYQLGVVAPEISVAYRFALASAILAAWCLVAGVSLRFARREHSILAAFGATLFGLNYIGVYWSERFVASGLVAVVFSTIVFMSPIGMRLVFGERLTLRMLVAATLGGTGVALLFLPELDAARHGGAAALGVALAFGATAIATVGNLIAVRNHKAGLPTFPATAWGMFYGALTAALAAMITGVPWTFEATASYALSLVYLALFGSVFAFGAYLTLLKRVGAGPSSFVGVATPVLALVLSTLFEGYRWTWVGAVGVVLAVAGNWLALRARPSPDPPA